jgi:hypothetical protein
MDSWSDLRGYTDTFVDHGSGNSSVDYGGNRGASPLGFWTKIARFRHAHPNKGGLGFGVLVSATVYLGVWAGTGSFAGSWKLAELCAGWLTQ